MKLFLCAFILMSAPAFAGNDKGGVAVTASVGKGGSKIGNPDGTIAHYKVLALEGRGHIPLIDTKSFNADLIGTLRYLDIENTANTKYQSEVGNMIGPGAGLELRAYRFVAGFHYDVLLARHYAVGHVSRDMKYNMMTTTAYGGLTYQFQQLAVSITYSQSSGTVPKSASGLTKDSPYEDQIYWLSLTYSTGASFSKFLNFLF